MENTNELKTISTRSTSKEKLTDKQEMLYNLGGVGCQLILSVWNAFIIFSLANIRLISLVAMSFPIIDFIADYIYYNSKLKFRNSKIYGLLLITSSLLIAFIYSLEFLDTFISFLIIPFCMIVHFALDLSRLIYFNLISRARFNSDKQNSFTIWSFCINLFLFSFAFSLSKIVTDVRILNIFMLFVVLLTLLLFGIEHYNLEADEFESEQMKVVAINYDLQLICSDSEALLNCQKEEERPSLFDLGAGKNEEEILDSQSSKMIISSDLDIISEKAKETAVHMNSQFQSSVDLQSNKSFKDMNLNSGNGEETNDCNLKNKLCHIYQNLGQYFSQKVLDVLVLYSGVVIHTYFLLYGVQFYLILNLQSSLNSIQTIAEAFIFLNLGRAAHYLIHKKINTNLSSELILFITTLVNFVCCIILVLFNEELESSRIEVMLIFFIIGASSSSSQIIINEITADYINTAVFNCNDLFLVAKALSKIISGLLLLILIGSIRYQVFYTFTFLLVIALVQIFGLAFYLHGKYSASQEKNIILINTYVDKDINELHGEVLSKFALE